MNNSNIVFVPAANRVHKCKVFVPFIDSDLPAAIDALITGRVRWKLPKSNQEGTIYHPTLRSDEMDLIVSHGFEVVDHDAPINTKRKVAA